jgi:phage N-6-adenine-methyltransferase
MSFTDNTTGKYEWETPVRFFEELDREFHFTVDVCAKKGIAKCKRYYTPKKDGLKQDWTGETCWMNPPYGIGIGMWLKKAAESRATVVCLVPSRTDNYWWHQWVMMADEIRFVRGRLRFVGAKWDSKFPSAIVIFRNNKEEVKI